MARIGIFSGTFDPVHSGHIAFCTAALAAAGLDRILLVPEPCPRGKAHVGSLEHRRAMLELSVRGEPRLSVLELPGERFTVAETLPHLEERFCGDDLYLLLGSDVVRTFTHGWPDLEKLLARMRLVIGLRAGDNPGAVQGLLDVVRQRHPALVIHATVIDSVHAYATSTSVRTAAGPATPLHPQVAAYITTHQLYAAVPA